MLCAALVAAVSVCGVHGATNEWANPFGGDLLESTNWNPVGVPSTNDVAVFRPLAETNAFAVSTVSDLAMGAVLVDGASIDLQLSGCTLAVNGGMLVTNGGGTMLRSGLLSSSGLGIVGASAGLAGGAAIDVAGDNGGVLLFDRGLLSVRDGGGSLTGRVLWAVMEADDEARIRVEGQGTVFRPYDGYHPLLDVGNDPFGPFAGAQGTSVLELADGAAIDVAGDNGGVLLHDRALLSVRDGGGSLTGRVLWAVMEADDVARIRVEGQGTVFRPYDGYHPLLDVGNDPFGPFAGAQGTSVLELADGAAIDVAGDNWGVVLHDRALFSVVDGGGSLTGRVLWAVMEADDQARIRVEGEGTLFRPYDPMGPMGESGAYLEVGANPNQYVNPYYGALGTAVVELAGGAAIDLVGHPDYGGLGEGGLVMYDRGLLSVRDGGGSLTGKVLWAVMEADDQARIRVEGEGTLFRPYDPMGPMGESGAYLEVGANPNQYVNPYYGALGTAVVELAGGAAIDGTVILYDRGVLRFVDGGGQVTGGLTMTGGTVRVEGASIAELAYLDSNPGSEFWIDPNARARFSGLVTGSADFRGGGTVEFLGGLSPGNSPAAISFEGDVLLGSNNVLTLELGGLIAGSEYDQLIVDGNLAFGGTMEVLLIDLFDPAAGDAFRLLQFGSSSNTFVSISLPSLEGGLTWDTTRLYSEGWLSVLAIPEPHPIFAAIGLLIGAWALRRTRRR